MRKHIVFVACSHGFPVTRTTKVQDDPLYLLQTLKFAYDAEG